MPITLKQMRYAVAIDQEGHFGRASQICHVTQPALSQQINLLEEICGTNIFDRASKPIKTTPFGAEFIARSKVILHETNRLVSFSLSQQGKPHHPIRFGLIPTIAPYLLPDIFPLLQQNLPEVAFNVSEAKTEQLLEAIETGNLDMALIATEPEKATRFNVKEIIYDPFVLATSKKQKDISNPADLTDIPIANILLLNEGHCLRDQTIKACNSEHKTSINSFAATSLSTIMEFVANEQGVTLLPTLSLKKEANDNRIQLVNLTPASTGRMINLVWHEASPFSELFNQITSIIKQASQARISHNHHTYLGKSSSPQA